VEPGDPPPAQHQQAAAHDEQDEGQVEQEDEVGEQSGDGRNR